MILDLEWRRKIGLFPTVFPEQRRHPTETSFVDCDDRYWCVVLLTTILRALTKMVELSKRTKRLGETKLISPIREFMVLGDRQKECGLIPF